MQTDETDETTTTAIHDPGEQADDSCGVGRTDCSVAVPTTLPHELPRTGPVDSLGSLTLIAVVLIAIGARLLRIVRRIPNADAGRDSRYRVDG